MAKTIKGDGLINGTDLAEIIIGGKGDDTITGGAGENIIEYHLGDGNDVINVSKGEILNININGISSIKDSSIVEYSSNKKDVIIVLIKTTSILRLKMLRMLLL